MKNEIITSDLSRYGKVTRRTIICHPEIKWLIIFRKAQNSKTALSKCIHRFKLNRLTIKTGIQIPPKTNIGEGFYIGHCGRIIINPQTSIGKNVNIATGVVIGQENRGKRKGCPTIGNKVWIGANSVIVGNIKIGNDVLIAPLTYINFDVPSHSIVIGNPGRIIHKDNATKDYINRAI